MTQPDEIRLATRAYVAALVEALEENAGASSWGEVTLFPDFPDNLITAEDLPENLVTDDDPRLVDQRTPLDDSVTLTKLSAALQVSIAKADSSLDQTAVDARVQQIVGAAPSALDTLDELAAALGDDANFAASVTTSLAGKVPTTRAINVGTGMTGGGTLASDRTLALVFGETAGTVMAGNWRPGWTDLQGEPSDNQIPQEAVDGLTTVLSTKASTSQVLAATDNRVVVHYTAAGWGTRPTTTGEQYIHFNSWRLFPTSDPGLTEADLIAAPTPPMLDGDCWDPHPQSAIFATLA